MTLTELCTKYNINENTFKNNPTQAKKSLLKKYGVEIIKEGRGASAIYTEIVQNDFRALTLYDEKKKLFYMDENSIKLINWEFISLVAIILTPMLVFRGNTDAFLSYMGKTTTAANKKAVQLALLSLKEKGYIDIIFDDIDNYFTATLKRAVEKEMAVQIGMVKTCKTIADKHGKRNWDNLLKTWIGMEKLRDTQPFTMAELSELVNLSEKTLLNSKKLLKQENVITYDTEYVGKMTCVGTTMDTNAIY